MENEVIYESKSYKHLDYPTEYETVKDYVTNSDKISRHSFLPFIKFEQITEKMTGIPNPDMDNRPVKRKVRPLMYAGHLDGFIYKYYSDLLNEQYNLYAVNSGINDNAIAYRSNDLS